VAAVDDLPVPGPVTVCPAPEIGPDGVVVIPPDAPADCAYIQAVPDMDETCVPPEGIGSEAGPTELPICPSVIAPGPDDSCAVSSDGTSTCDDTPVMEPPAGDRYELSAITLPDGSRITVEGGYLLLVDGAFTASVGCTTLGGTRAIDGDPLRFGSVIATEMACEGKMLAEAALIGILGVGWLHLDTEATPVRLANDAGELELVATSLENGAGMSETSGGGLGAVLLLLLPILAAGCALAIGLSTSTTTKER
jgi:hypothetical protein